MGTLADAWDAVARAYDVYWGPRFAPWAARTLEVVVERAADLPDGRVLVPTCGPGRELGAIVRALPGRPVLGLDLSPGMIALAQVRCAGSPSLHAEVADATALAEPFGPAAAILSVFGFQQLPDPAAALADWCQALAPGGVAAVCYWPTELRDSGPYAVAGPILRAHGTPPPERPWADRLEAVVAASGGGLLRDERPAFEIQHDGPAAFWDAMVDAGAWRPLADRVGAETMASMRAEFLVHHPPGPITHSPSARLLVVYKSR